MIRLEPVNYSFTRQQVECLVNGKLPSNLSNVIVFTRAGLSQLHNRIGELEEEKLSLKQQQV